TENVLAELDGMFGGVDGINNFYLYQFAGTTLYQVIPWDKDLTFWDGQRDILYGLDVNHVTRRLLWLPEYRRAYFDALNKAATIFGGPGGWAEKEIDRMYTLTHDSAAADTHKQCIKTDGTIFSCGI